MILEICASNYQSAINAEAAGAHRIELCSELAVGGVTPSYGLLKQVMQKLTIPVFVLIRPRSGDFNYSEADFGIMKQDIQLCKELGCQGIVSGVLNPDNSIDIDRTKELIALARPMKFTFHRAFDWTPNPFEALDTLIDLKVDRILTSGQCSSAEKGILILNQLQKLAQGKLIILPGSGINPNNVLIFKGAGFSEVHCSAVLSPDVPTSPPLPMNTQKLLNDGQEMASNPEVMISILQRIND
ncbi:copper homeostasis protein [Gelidibacter sediminis]|uniref:PF03932 family protein CutC n=1 Tax=Gelidibacter sediminis TaxID=1608710 RepID=A0A4R7PZT2_9FLAO|nr:copper homeostasis protein CutC [Gelidibacter sediminis]TDU40564.1 copper homeostasis protein [Gelidibacter sediminis]